MPRERRQPADYVTCKLCRREFRAITFLHLRNIHGYDGDHPIIDYKRRFRLNSATCLESRKRISAAKADFWAKRGQHWTRATLLAEIRRVHRSGRSLIRRKIPVRLYEAGRRFFGTWQAAVGKAGLNYEDVTGVRRWDRKKVLEKIQELAAEGVPLNATHVGRYYPFLHSRAVRCFPYSWRKALRAAGLDPDEYEITRGRWDRSKAEDWVRRRFASKRSILARDVPRDIRDFVYRHLGISWPQFLQTLGIQYPGVERRSDWTKRKLIEEIRRWNAEGNRLNYRAVKLGYQALIHQARKFFGSWDRARASAGV